MPLYATPLVRAGSPQRVQVLLGLVPKQVLLGLVPNRSRLADQAIEASLQLVSATFTARQSQSERKVDAEEKLSLGPHADVLTAIAIAQESTPSLTETRALENVTLGTYDGVRWLSGGVGEFERQAIMETVAKDYSLKLEFARADGSHLSNVDVIVSDTHGRAVATVTSSGPWLLLDLPAGAYRIRASIERRPSFEHAVDVSGSGMQAVVFDRWEAETDSL